jgi:hypothetical protein
MNQPNIISRRVILFDAEGKGQHFDVTVNLEDIAKEQAKRAMYNRSHVSVVAGGAVRVEYLPS